MKNVLQWLVIAVASFTALASGAEELASASPEASSEPSASISYQLDGGPNKRSRWVGKVYEVRDADGLLVGVRTMRGRSQSFNYDQKRRLAWIDDFDGGKIIPIYESANGQKIVGLVRTKGIGASSIATLPVAIDSTKFGYLVDKRQGFGQKTGDSDGSGGFGDPQLNEYADIIEYYAAMGGCALYCVGVMDAVFNYFSNGWAAISAFLGGLYGVTFEALVGGLSALSNVGVVADIIAVYGFAGVTVGVVFVAGYAVGTVIYDQYGHILWRSF